MLVLGLKAEVHITNKETVLTLIEEPPLITLYDGVVVDVLNVLLPFRRGCFACSQVAIHDS